MLIPKSPPLVASSVSTANRFTGSANAGRQSINSAWNQAQPALTHDILSFSGHSPTRANSHVASKQKKPHFSTQSARNTFLKTLDDNAEKIFRAEVDRIEKEQPGTSQGKAYTKAWENLYAKPAQDKRILAEDPTSHAEPVISPTKSTSRLSSPTKTPERCPDFSKKENREDYLQELGRLGAKGIPERQKIIDDTNRLGSLREAYKLSWERRQQGGLTLAQTRSTSTTTTVQHKSRSSSPAKAQQETGHFANTKEAVAYLKSLQSDQKTEIFQRSEALKQQGGENTLRQAVEEFWKENHVQGKQAVLSEHSDQGKPQEPFQQAVLPHAPAIVKSPSPVPGIEMEKAQKADVPGLLQALQGKPEEGLQEKVRRLLAASVFVPQNPAPVRVDIKQKLETVIQTGMPDQITKTLKEVYQAQVEHFQGLIGTPPDFLHNDQERHQYYNHLFYKNQLRYIEGVIGTYQGQKGWGIQLPIKVKDAVVGLSYMQNWQREQIQAKLKRMTGGSEKWNEIYQSIRSNPYKKAMHNNQRHLYEMELYANAVRDLQASA